MNWPMTGVEKSNIDDILMIHASKTEPDASLAVKYRGYWFFIADTDMVSKSAFLVMAELYRLSISEGRPDQVPVLTLPVGAP